MQYFYGNQMVPCPEYGAIDDPAELLNLLGVI